MRWGVAGGGGGSEEGGRDGKRGTGKGGGGAEMDVVSATLAFKMDRSLSSEWRACYGRESRKRAT